MHGAVVASGEADVAYQIPALSTDQYIDNSDAELLSIGQSGTGLQMIFNLREPKLQDIRLRQALLHARDMGKVNDILYDGLYGEADGPLNNIHPCFWDGASEMYPHDPEKAKALLEEAGWVEGEGALRVAKGVEGVPDGERLELGWSILHHPEIGEVVQAQFLDVGVGISVEKVPGPIQLERVNARDFEIMYERLRSPDPKILDDIWNSQYDYPGGWAWTGYVNEDLNALLKEVAGNPSWDARCDAAKAAQKHIMENALVLPTLSQPSYFAVSSKVDGFKLGAEGTHFFIHDVSIN
ncbi:MAG: ABC transporter substrate-binding protein [Planctomycetota bacterium]